jgi:hypothetical protein
MTGFTQAISRKIATTFTYAPLVIMLGYLAVSILIHPIFFVPTAVYWWLIFHGDLDQVYIMGNLYWITKRDSRTISAGKGTMHQTYTPWRKGSGVYIALFKHCFQIGWAKPQNLSEEAGILSATQGRFLQLTPHEIGNGNWDALQKGN